MTGAPSRVLIVGCGFPQLGLIRAARELGLYVIGVDANPRAIGAARVRLSFTKCSTHDVDAHRRGRKTTRADGITTCGSEIALTSTARAAARLGSALLRRRRRPSIAARPRICMRTAYAEGARRSRRSLLAHAFAEVEAFARYHGLPLVLKPSRGWGQRGVSKVEKRDELGRLLLGARRPLRRGSRRVEEFIEGKRVQRQRVHDGRGDDGLQRDRARDHVVPRSPRHHLRRVVPVGSTWRRRSARSSTRRRWACSALGIRRGPTYTQLRVGPRGAGIVETAYRLGGGLDPDVALLASGVSLFRKILGVALSARLGADRWARRRPART